MSSSPDSRNIWHIQYSLHALEDFIILYGGDSVDCFCSSPFNLYFTSPSNQGSAIHPYRGIQAAEWTLPLIPCVHSQTQPFSPVGDTVSLFLNPIHGVGGVAPV